MADVAEYLGTEGLRNLRLSSRFLRDATLFGFVRRCFRHRRHIVTLESLECLLAISRHAVFGRAIRIIEISGRVSVGSRNGTEKTLADRDFIHKSGLVPLYLTEVFKNAICCRAVIVSSGKDMHWGETALVREARSSYPIQVEMPFSLGGPLWLL